MDINLATVMLHIHEPLNEQLKKELEDSVRADACVVSVGMPERPSQVMVVAYNPACTSSANILKRTTSTGVHARLVGCA